MFDFSPRGSHPTATRRPLLARFHVLLLLCHLLTRSFNLSPLHPLTGTLCHSCTLAVPAPVPTPSLLHSLISFKVLILSLSCSFQLDLCPLMSFSSLPFHLLELHSLSYPSLSQFPLTIPTCTLLYINCSPSSLIMPCLCLYRSLSHILFHSRLFQMLNISLLFSHWLPPSCHIPCMVFPLCPISL